MPRRDSTLFQTLDTQGDFRNSKSYSHQFLASLSAAGTYIEPALAQIGVSIVSLAAYLFI